MDFWYVYSLRSKNHPERYYVGITQNLEERLGTHNSGKISHTRKFKPWKFEVVIAFVEKEKAFAFEKYLKSHSGRAFAKRHF